jgi:DNA polymerase III sliding clamp (beta) subunit (PCNA family)
MQVQVQKLREAMQLLEPVVPGKTALPILHNVLLKDGRAIAGDLETFVFIDLPEADMECLIPHNSVMELLKYVPGNEMLTIEADGELTLSWDGGKSSYPCAKPEEYPPEPELVVKTEGSMDGNVLMTALTSSAKYCATEQDRPVLNGVAIFPGENLDIAAGDGFRMAYQTIPATFPIEKPLIIPSSAVWVLNSLWQHTKPDVAIGDSLVGLVMSKRQATVALVEAKSSGAELLRLCFSGVTALIKLIQGTPPNFKQLIPKDIPTTVKFFPGDLERAVKRLRPIAKDDKGIVRLSWTKDTMTVSASSEEVGKVEGTLSVQADNPDRVGINIKYLLEYLKGKEGMITLGLSSGTTPVVLRHRASPLVLVMPMMVQW